MKMKGVSKMWELYDRLLEPIPDHVLVEEILVGAGSTMVKAGGLVGVAATQRLESRPRLLNEEEVGQGMTLKEAASLIRSWNFLEAGIGAAAINAYYNQEGKVQAAMKDGKARILENRDAFAALQWDLAGKRVATIGHFWLTQDYLQEAAEVFILEREPKAGDYPDTACEYILPGMDYVFITGFTLVNKTLPRLLMLSKGAKVILVGPSVPMAPALFLFGVDELAGTLIADAKMLEAILRRGSHKAVIRSGKPVRLERV